MERDMVMMLLVVAASMGSQGEEEEEEEEMLSSRASSAWLRSTLRIAESVVGVSLPVWFALLATALYASLIRLNVVC